MSEAEQRPDEAAALEALHGLQVLDTRPEPVFDAIVKAASIVVGAPISLVSLVDADRQWFKANIGLPGVTETPRSVAFCAHAVLQDELFEVPDATKDPRFSDNPLVANDPSIRFYAGMPLTLRDGHRVGTLCVIDRKPRHLDEHQREILRSLGKAATHALEGRRAMEAVKEAALETARSEHELALERRRLATVLEGAHVGLWDLNLKTGAAKVSPRWAEIIGESLESLGTIALSAWSERVHPDDVERVLARFNAHLTGQTPRYEAEMRVRHHDGHWVSVVDNGRVMTRARDGKVEWIVGSRVDVTSRRRQEDQLRMSESFLHRTGQVAGVGGWLVDLVSGYIHWSEETYRIHGLPLDYVPVLDAALDFYEADARPQISAAVESAIAGGPGWDLELPLRRADGRRIWVRTVGNVEVDGDKIVRLVGALQDVTSRVIEHQALRSANDRIQLATDAGGIGIWELDLRTNETIWDVWMFRIYGLAPGDRRVKPEVWAEHLPDESSLRLRSAIEGAIIGAPFDVEFDITWTDGTVRHVRNSARLTRDHNGKPARLVGATWDVTDARRNAAELRRQSLLATVQAGVAMAANQARTLTDALQSTVDLVCAHTGWPVGHVYIRSPEDYELLVSTQIWNAGAVDVASFCEESARTTFSYGEGLVGLAIRDRRPAVLEVLSKPPFKRIASATEHGLRWALAAPVLVGEEIVAVLEFFGRDTFDRSYIDLASFAGVQLGRVVDRERANAVLERRTEALREQSRVDELTGLYNRRGFMELADERRATAARSGQRVFLLFADLDGMKRINDQLGHDVGDLAIRELAGVLRRTLRTADVVARLGGDEFVALTIETGTFATLSLLSRLQAEVARVNRDSRLPFELAVSFGFAGPADPTEPLTDVLKRADEEMYRSKVARKKARESQL